MPIQENISIIEPILARGGLAQVNSFNLEPSPDGAGEMNPLITGPTARKTTRELLRQGWVHIIASDAHDTDFRRPDLKVAYHAAAEIVGDAKALAMVLTTPQAILNDEPVII